MNQLFLKRVIGKCRKITKVMGAMIVFESGFRLKLKQFLSPVYQSDVCHAWLDIFIESDDCYA